MTPPPDSPARDALRITRIDGKGRGVVAVRPISAGTLLEVAPVIPLAAADQPPRSSVLYDYPFLWDAPPYIEAIALGYISMLNHSDRPNAQFETDIPGQLVRLSASRDIAAGDEVCIDYGIPLWFEAR